MLIVTVCVMTFVDALVKEEMGYMHIYIHCDQGEKMQCS